jgi:hypothetical protein
MAIDSIEEMRIHPMENPDVVVAEFSIRGKALTTGRPYNQRYVSILEAKNGKIWHYREYFNPLISMTAFAPGESS